MRTTVRPSICTGRLPSAVKIELLSTSFCTLTYSALLLGNTMLRSISEWGQMEVTTKQSVSGLTTGPPAAIDSMDWDGVVGTIAGDDTIFVLCRSEREAQIFTVNLEKMLHA